MLSQTHTVDVCVLPACTTPRTKVGMLRTVHTAQESSLRLAAFYIIPESNAGGRAAMLLLTHLCAFKLIMPAGQTMLQGIMPAEMHDAFRPGVLSLMREVPIRKHVRSPQGCRAANH